MKGSEVLRDIIVVCVAVCRVGGAGSWSVGVAVVVREGAVEYAMRLSRARNNNFGGYTGAVKTVVRAFRKQQPAASAPGPSGTEHC